MSNAQQTKNVPRVNLSFSNMKYISQWRYGNGLRDSTISLGYNNETDLPACVQRIVLINKHGKTRPVGYFDVRYTSCLRLS